MALSAVKRSAMSVIGVPDFSPAESYGVSAQIGAGEVWGSFQKVSEGLT